MEATRVLPETIKVLLEAHANIEAQDNAQRTPLHLAKRRLGHEEAVRLLMQYGAK